MKQKLNVSIEEKTIEKHEEFVKCGKFRNKSHFVEFAIDKFIKESEK